MQVEERVRRAGDDHRDLDAADDELRVALEQRARERTVGIGVVRVRDDVGVTADGVGPHGSQLVGERETSAAATAQSRRGDPRDGFVRRELAIERWNADEIGRASCRERGWMW